VIDRPGEPPRVVRASRPSSAAPSPSSSSSASASLGGQQEAPGAGRGRGRGRGVLPQGPAVVQAVVQAPQQPQPQYAHQSYAQTPSPQTASTPVSAGRGRGRGAVGAAQTSTPSPRPTSQQPQSSFSQGSVNPVPLYNQTQWRENDPTARTQSNLARLILPKSQVLIPHSFLQISARSSVSRRRTREITSSFRPPLL